jgi:hypothetical protein
MPKRWRVAMLVAAAIAISYLDRQALPVAVQAIEADIPLTNTQFGKVSVGQFDGWIGEAQISYAGPGAAARGRLAGEIVVERLRLTRVPLSKLRCDLIGVNALHKPDAGRRGAEPYAVRLRVAARTPSAADGWRVAREVESLYTNGPAGGSGAFTSVRQVLAMRSTFVPRDRVSWRVEYESV